MYILDSLFMLLERGGKAETQRAWGVLRPASVYWYQMVSFNRNTSPISATSPDSTSMLQFMCSDIPPAGTDPNMFLRDFCAFAIPEALRADDSLQAEVLGESDGTE